METIGSKRSYALIWCSPNNDDDECQKLNRRRWGSGSLGAPGNAD